MIDNKIVSGNHQKGIERVLQRKGDLDKGQGGKMQNRPKEEANWKRSGTKLTPRKA